MHSGVFCGIIEGSTKFEARLYACLFAFASQLQMLYIAMATSNYQTYFVIKKTLSDFINTPTFKHKNAADVSRAADLKSARTAANVLGGRQVSMKTAKKVWGMCSVEGFSHDFEMAFEKVNGN